RGGRDGCWSHRGGAKLVRGGRALQVGHLRERGHRRAAQGDRDGARKESVSGHVGHLHWRIERSHQRLPMRTLLLPKTPPWACVTLPTLTRVVPPELLFPISVVWLFIAPPWACVTAPTRTSVRPPPDALPIDICWRLSAPAWTCVAAPTFTSVRPLSLALPMS